MKLKTTLAVLLFLVLAKVIYSQETTGLEDNVNVKLGLLKASLAYEYPLSNTFLLNAELEYRGGFTNGDYIVTSAVAIAPRYYYNLNKRVSKGKTVKNNAANYIALNLSYLPDMFTASNTDSDLEVVKSFNVIPTYGLRRNIDGNFNFDFEFGLGYAFLEDGDSVFTGNLFLGVSYVF